MKKTKSLFVIIFIFLQLSCSEETGKSDNNAVVVSEDAIEGVEKVRGLSYGEEHNSVRFSLARSGGPNLDPHSVQGDLELHFNPNVFEGLLKIDPDSGELVPCLAEGYDWITPQIIEFQLRKDLVFHNDEPFNAESVKFSFERMAAVEEGFNWIKAVLPEFERVEIIDPYKVRIHLSHHNSIFLISSRFFVILPPQYLKQNGVDYFLRNPVGTGPFKVKKIDYKESVVKTIYMEKNLNYWDAGKPAIDELTYHFGFSQEESFQLLSEGKIEAMGDLPIRKILEAKKTGLEVHSKGQGLISWLYFNLSRYKKDSPIWNPDVRKAIIHSINFDQIKKVVYNNRAEQNNQWAFPGIPGYNPESENYAYDPEKSKQLLKQAGYAEGFSLYAYCDDVSLDEALILQSSVKQIGIDIQFDILNEAENNCFLSSRRDPDSPCHHLLSKYDFMIGDFSWGLPHNYVSHLHTFSQDSFVSMVSEDYPDAGNTVALFNEAKRAFGTEADDKWKAISAYELDRLSVAGLMLKDTYYSTVENLVFEVYGSYDFSEAKYNIEK